MNKIIGIIFTFIMVFSLSGCINEEDVNTKDFYIKNDNARITKIKYCNDRPDKKLVDQNCVNAIDAHSQLKSELLRSEGIKVDYSAAYVEGTYPSGEKKFGTKFYLDYEKEFTEKLEFCENNPEKNKRSIPNCESVMKAQEIKNQKIAAQRSVDEYKAREIAKEEKRKKLINQ